MNNFYTYSTYGIRKEVQRFKRIDSNVEFREEFKSKALRKHDKQGRSCRQIFAEAAAKI